MKLKTTLMIFLLCTAIHYPVQAQTGMIADITHDVETEFGTYHPCIVDIVPDITDYIVDDNLNNVINLADYRISAEMKDKLKENHFVVHPPEETYNEIFDVYNKLREDGVPIFVTTDAMLHTFHLCFDYILMTIESKEFIPDLRALLDEMIYQSTLQLADASDAAVAGALEKNLNYLYVATHLLDSTYTPDSPDQAYYDELQLIAEHDQPVISPIFEYEEDYTQYIPRGHYTKTDSLKHYFLSMMWLGRMTFAAEEHKSELSEKMTLSAILLVHAMLNSKIGAEDGMSLWERIYNPTVFFVGKSDDINFYQYQALCEQVYGGDFDQLPVSVFADTSKLSQFLQLCYDLEGPKITYPGQPKGFRFMGQRFTPDSWMLDELVFNKVHDMRLMPYGLDVMTILGSNTADELLTEMGEKSRFPNYAVKLDSMKVLFDSYEDDIWAQNVYWNWLYSLMPLLMFKGDGYPYFMKSDAWKYKDLNAALASWGELRHDTILYVKQSGSERAVPDASNLVQGYVEPNPHLYARLASLATLMIEGLNSNNLLLDNFEYSLRMLGDLLLSLKEIAEKELTNEILTPTDYELICNIGTSLEQIVEFSKYEPEGPFPDGMKMPVIADVHSDFNSYTCLEEAVGYPYEILVICPVEGQVILTKGAGFTYYEFIQPMDHRLTDEEWQDMLQTDRAPDMPKWTSTFIEGASPGPIEPTGYEWSKRGLQRLIIELDKHEVAVNNPVQILIKSDIPNSNIQITIESPEGKTESHSIQSDTNGDGSLSYTPTHIGAHAITVVHSTKNYRTRFMAFSATNIEDRDSKVKPDKFCLNQNYPNPFNASTTISFSIPENEYVQLLIYNLRGERVRTLVSNTLKAGTYMVPWHARDDNKTTIASGVYIAKITAGRYSYTRKMVVLF